MSGARQIILSCEHAGNRVPKKYEKLFASSRDVLQTHKAYDIGILSVASKMQRLLGCPLCRYPWTRLLIDVNRRHRRTLFSNFSKELSRQEQDDLIDNYYDPYRQELDGLIWKHRNVGVLHLSLHSFTPIFKGKKRNAEIGILYDPSRKEEAGLAIELQRRLRMQTGLRIRRNYPYLGRSDGATSWLRTKYIEQEYLGIEIELNQALLIDSSSKFQMDIAKFITHAMMD